jgi:hypothetical protein
LKLKFVIQECCIHGQGASNRVESPITTMSAR